MAEYYFLNEYKDWNGRQETDLPAHSTKDFFMPDTKEPEIVWDSESFVKGDRPRTYRVTRSQMKEIWQRCTGAISIRIEQIVDQKFMWYADEAELTEPIVKEIVGYWDSYQNQRDFLKSIFPEYFFIPEGEPVLYRNSELDDWHAGISFGEGRVYVAFRSTGNWSWIVPKQIIPFTKNPPK